MKMKKNINRTPEETTLKAFNVKQTVETTGIDRGMLKLIVTMGLVTPPTPGKYSLKNLLEISLIQNMMRRGYPLDVVVLIMRGLEKHRAEKDFFEPEIASEVPYFVVVGETAQAEELPPMKIEDDEDMKRAKDYFDPATSDNTAYGFSVLAGDPLSDEEMMLHIKHLMCNKRQVSIFPLMSIYYEIEQSLLRSASLSEIQN